MDRKANILFLASWYPSRVSPFNGNFVQRHARSVASFANVSVLHACSDPDCKSKIEIEVNQNATLTEVIAYYRKVTHNIPLLSQLQKYLRNRKALKKGFSEIQKRSKTDLVHLNVTFPAGLFALHLRKKFNIPYILTEHWTIFTESDPSAFPRGARNSIRKILKNASMICPVSHDLERAIKKLSPENEYRVVNNVVDTDLFGVASPANEKKKIIHVSTLNDHQKNISGILRAVKKLSVVRNDFEILIVGDGDIAPHLSYAKELGISEDVLEFKGKQPIENIAAIMQQSDVFLLFSNYENLPCVIIEAHASGLPVISSDVGGISEMINEGNGVLLQAGDEKALVEKISDMLDKLKAYEREKIRDEAVNKYSYPVIGKQFAKIYEEIIQQNSAQ